MWYLMSAYSLTEKKRAPVYEVPKHWDEAVVYVCKMSNDKLRFCVSCGDLGQKIGDEVEWKNDTGLGYRPVPWNERMLKIVNIIRFNKDGKYTSEVENGIGLKESAPIYVFK